MTRALVGPTPVGPALVVPTPVFRAEPWSPGRAEHRDIEDLRSGAPRDEPAPPRACTPKGCSPLLARLRGDDDGSILPLTIFYSFFCLILVLLVVSASSLYLERKRLFTLADGAALAGAESFALEELAPTATGLRPTLRSGAVRSAVDDYLRSTPDGRFDGLFIEDASSADGLSARVTLSAFWRPPLLTLLVPDGLRIEVTAVGRSVVR